MEARQLINIGRVSSTATTSTHPHCTPFTLPSNGVLTLGVSSVVTLTEDAVFRPECTGSSEVILSNSGGSPSTILDFRDPFYASTIPECYALASATVIAYMLVIMLLITPRTFLHDGIVILGRRGFTNGPSGSDAGIGVGGRPWLQKVAALTVAISLTIATADTFRVAEKQYEVGYMDASALQKEVEDGTELKVIRVISDTFLWLAQAQTLIRLFPRQREKVIIKYTAFALITLDVLFSILNNFVYNGNSRPRSFVDAVPALSYLFQLALSLLYSAWVIYYGITKKRYAFYHPQMKNMCLVALLSVIAVLVPTVFFVLDISKPDLAGWGDYIRWVGAAAASVVVWEWVERIEALERNEKKDGVLGREVFDGDEMLETTPSSESAWQKLRNHRPGDGGGGSGGTAAATGSNRKLWPGMATIASRYRPRPAAPRDVEHEATAPTTSAFRKTTKRIARVRPPLWPTRPPPAATPVSRTDTASAESTVYAVRYHPISEATPPVGDTSRPLGVSRSNSTETDGGQRGPVATDLPPESEPPVILEHQSDKPIIMERNEAGHGEAVMPTQTNAWQTLAKANPFRRKNQAPPAEVSAHVIKQEEPTNSHGGSNKWDVRGRFEEFAASQADKLRDKSRPTEAAAPLARTIIPAPPRRRNLQATLEELENEGNGSLPEARPFSPESLRIQGQQGDFSRQRQAQRTSDPYTPDDIARHWIHQRGAIAFVTADRERQHDDDLISPVSPTEEPRDRNTPLSFRSNTIPAAITPSSSSREGLPVRSIPAPPRRPRTDDDD
ncbi:PalH/RIM21-domain-containing protein [Amylocarpus encephaloides]|uniref:PalH/RIM21-domain-containing protein n=1 Tax=Amylocarpus encephaloides TaxID=45428 RepID=A0A9P7YSN7_9HELO|nr:PalH/RIM21-domain-containing protein [Amylocarpus encephaloides]